MVAAVVVGVPEDIKESMGGVVSGEVVAVLIGVLFDAVGPFGIKRGNPLVVAVDELVVEILSAEPVPRIESIELITARVRGPKTPWLEDGVLLETSVLL